VARSATTPVRVDEITRTLPFYAPSVLTPLPIFCHREHLFPYSSYGDTSATPAPRAFRMVRLENEFLRVEVAPELGGRVYSLFDKRIGQEILFSNPVVKPVRILPVWGFISGGIEFNFPMAHSPTSIAAVGCATGQLGDYAYIRVGEREARSGMEWVVELGLCAGSPVLVQRIALRNLTGADHRWMLWTICAVRSTEDTEYIHPPHPALVHDDRLTTLEWPGEGLNWERNLRQMTAVFWKPGDAPHLGAFHHDLGFGLMHLADPAQLPGKKLWTYGQGKHRCWANDTTEGSLAYSELESGPLLDQSEKSIFPAGGERRFEEFWIPVHAREECERLKMPKLDLQPMADPWLGWQHSPWQSEWEAFRTGTEPLPASTVPTGLELEDALRREQATGNARAAEPLALWLNFRGRSQEALALVENNSAPTARRIAGLILWTRFQNPAGARPHLEAGPLHDPVAVVELDELYAELGLTNLRQPLLNSAPSHRKVIERRVHLAIVEGNPELAIRLLTDTRWPREHQRYVRTELWRRAKAALKEVDAPVPDFLHEDNLAQFGAYWSDDRSAVGPPENRTQRA